ncbi:Gfo/Idh/MocA family protein [Spirillospora sp. CA-255316]
MSVESLGILAVGGMESHLEIFVPLFAADPRVTVVAVAEDVDATSDQRALAQQAAAWLGVPFVDTLEQALQLPGVDIVIATPGAERRASMVARCARAGKHLFLDKPVIAGPGESAILVEQVLSSGVHSRVWSFAQAPWLQAGVKAARATSQLESLRCDIYFAKGIPDLDRPVNRRERTGGTYTFPDAKRELAEIGFYGISAVLRAARSIPESVVARTGNYFHRSHAARDVEDFAAVVIQMSCGAVASVTCGRYGMGSHPQGGIGRFSFTADGETRVFDAWRPRLAVHSAEIPLMSPVDERDPMSMWPSTTPSDIDTLRWRAEFNSTAWPFNEARSFIDGIFSGEVETDLDIVHAAQVDEVVLAAYRSTTSGRPEAVVQVPHAGETTRTTQGV